MAVAIGRPIATTLPNVNSRTITAMVSPTASLECVSGLDTFWPRKPTRPSGWCCVPGRPAATHVLRRRCCRGRSGSACRFSKSRSALVLGEVTLARAGLADSSPRGRLGRAVNARTRARRSLCCVLVVGELCALRRGRARPGSSRWPARGSAPSSRSAPCWLSVPGSVRLSLASSSGHAPRGERQSREHHEAQTREEDHFGGARTAARGGTGQGSSDAGLARGREGDTARTYGRRRARWKTHARVKFGASAFAGTTSSARSAGGPRRA